jgi:signal peptidase I
MSEFEGDEPSRHQPPATDPAAAPRPAAGDAPPPSWTPPVDYVPPPGWLPPPLAETPPLSETPPLPEQPNDFESSRSALDDELSDSLGIDGVADGSESAAPGLSPAPSPLPRPPGYGRHRIDRPPPDLARFDAAASGSPYPIPPGPLPPGSVPPGSVPPGSVPPAGVTPEFDAPGTPPPKPKRRRKAPWWELPLLVIVAIVIAILVKSFVVQPFYIPSQSMEKTLHGCSGCKGDRILVNKPIYDLRDPHPGDIVVFHAPPGWDDEQGSKPPSNPLLKAVRGFGQLVGVIPPDGLVLVKRVIATGGQTVQGDASGHVMISDHGTAGPWRTLNEPYVFEDGVDPRAAFGPVTVPKGRLWVMGDHRNDSADSRYHCGAGGSQGSDGPDCDPTSATVPAHDVIGKAVLIAWPLSRWRTLGTPSTFKHTASALPVLGGAVAVFPLYLIRRRSRKAADPSAGPAEAA